MFNATFFAARTSTNGGAETVDRQYLIGGSAERTKGYKKQYVAIKEMMYIEKEISPP